MAHETYKIGVVINKGDYLLGWEDILSVGVLRKKDGKKFEIVATWNLYLTKKGKFNENAFGEADVNADMGDVDNPRRRVYRRTYDLRRTLPFAALPSQRRDDRCSTCRLQQRSTFTGLRNSFCTR